MVNTTGVTRKTVQKQLVNDIFLRAGRPLTAREAHDLARVARPRIGIATVYRAIRRMVEAKELRLVVIPGEAAYYERSGNGHHHYFHCCACQKVYVVQGCPGSMKALTPAGFVLERHDLVLHGKCKTCAARR
ncbi:MAG TPA: transcriptional repressor [Candidatus Hydrogenedentes bacterium]|nr:transcriptional repressor [Candidatus Hydrogenedentota bacterium]